MVEMLLGKQVLDRNFYLQDTLCCAHNLVGTYLAVFSAPVSTQQIRLDEQNRIVEAIDLPDYTLCRMVETEAYLGKADKAAHSWKGDPNGRCKVMYGTGGKVYVYLIYGMYYCFNIVAAGPEIPHAILIRAAEPVFGLSQMTARRKAKSPLTPKAQQKLLAGPGKLCRHLGIDRSFYGEDLCGLQEGASTRVLVLADPKAAPIDVLATPRIHIDYAQEAKDFLYRFIDPQSPSLSQP